MALEIRTSKAYDLRYSTTKNNHTSHASKQLTTAQIRASIPFVLMKYNFNIKILHCVAN